MFSKSGHARSLKQFVCARVYMCFFGGAGYTCSGLERDTNAPTLPLLLPSCHCMMLAWSSGPGRARRSADTYFTSFGKCRLGDLRSGKQDHQTNATLPWQNSNIFTRETGANSSESSSKSGCTLKLDSPANSGTNNYKAATVTLPERPLMMIS